MAKSYLGGRGFISSYSFQASIERHQGVNSCRGQGSLLLSGLPSWPALLNFLYHPGPPDGDGTTHRRLHPPILIIDQENVPPVLLIGQPDGGSSSVNIACSLMTLAFIKKTN